VCSCGSDEDIGNDSRWQDCKRRELWNPSYVLCVFEVGNTVARMANRTALAYRRGAAAAEAHSGVPTVGQCYLTEPN